MEYFGLKLQTLRKKAGMSQEDLANLLGVSRQAISKWERSEALPDLYNAKKIAEVFNITLDDLMDIEIRPIDKDKERDNKLALAFLTVSGVFVGFGVIVFLFAFAGFNGIRSFNLYGILPPIVILFGLLYLYSLYNLYIGRKTQKFKYIILSLNFLLLLGYIVMLFNIVDYNQVPLLILLILILAIIVLGIIGGFMFNIDYSVDKTENYVKQTNVLKKTIKIISWLVSIYYLAVMGYLLLTHSVNQRVGVNYAVGLTNISETCDIDIDFRDNDYAELFMYCGSRTENVGNIERIVIYFDDLLIHDSDNINELDFIDEEDVEIMYSFNYPFEDIDDLQVMNVTITITTIDDEETYIGTVYNRSDDFNTVVVPIWVKGDN
jgi:transcriptional regulator with XRE-family HTH domain